MNRQLRCFLSASYEIDLTTIESVLAENDVEIFNLYDFAIGSSIQDILKRQLRQVDFAIFIITKDSKNLLYEIGVCEGLGKQSLIIFDKGADLPFYLENRLSLAANVNDRDFIKMTVLGFVDEIRSKIKPSKKSKIITKEPEKYDVLKIETLYSLLEQTKIIRKNGQSIQLEYVVEEIFKTIQLKYANNIYESDAGIDFALWSSKLGRILGNPIIVEVKFGRLGRGSFQKAESQIQKYAEKSAAKVALLLYLDKTDKRFKITPSLRPLIIAYDIEDFITDLIASNFENLILTRRNKIAHGN